MTERPILFSGEMVRAILAGRKTQTRRVMKWQPDDDGVVDVGEIGSSRGVAYVGNKTDGGHRTRVPCPYGAPGDRLWVREAWRTLAEADDIAPRDLMNVEPYTHYEADDNHDGMGKLRPGIFMPRWASRIDLEITSVRVERLQVISEADALAEGCEAKPFLGPWWQGYKEFDGDLIHQQAVGENPPDWMIEPKRMKETPHLDRSAIDAYRILWDQINGAGAWDNNPWVWVLEFRVLS